MMKVVNAVLGTFLGVGTIMLWVRFLREFATLTWMDLPAWVAACSIGAALTILFLRSALPSRQEPSSDAPTSKVEDDDAE